MDSQLHALLIRAFDGVQMGAKTSPRDVTDDTLAGIWWTLLVVSKAMEHNPLAITALERLSQGDVDLKALAE